jgi:aryl-alcohol dehydrogenase-like predicted oxidoreductase
MTDMSTRPHTDLTARPLRGTDLSVGRLVLGTMTFGTQLSNEDSVRAIHRARELGVTMFDCANSYGDGRAEEILGRTVRPFRDEVQVVTKVGSRRSVDDEDAPRLDRNSILQGCDDSLRRLGLDHIDLYYLHMPDARTPLDESLEACQVLVDAGKVRHVAMSNHAAWQVAHAVHLAEARDWPRIRALQPMYNLLARRLEEEYAACTQHFDIANLVYNPLAGGLLTGKHDLDAGPQQGTRFTWKTSYRDRYWHPALFRAVKRLAEIADDAGMSLIELSFRWLLDRPFVDGVIVGASSLEHLEANVAAADGEVPGPATVKAIDDVWEELGGPSPSYNR